MINDTRKEFTESWLAEMPTGIPDISFFNVIKKNLLEMSKYYPIQEVKPHLYKISGKETAYYWFGDKQNFDLIAEIDKKSQSIVINAVAKNPLLKGQPPFASDLYVEILNDNDNSILFSDKILSMNGLAVWKNLIKNGYAISVFDEHNPGKTRQTFQDPEQLDNFFQIHNDDYARYRYVLSKQGSQLAETIAYFNTRRMRELAGTL